MYIHTYAHICVLCIHDIYSDPMSADRICPFPKRRPAAARCSPTLDTLQRGVQWMGGAVDRGSII